MKGSGGPAGVAVIELSFQDARRIATWAFGRAQSQKGFPDDLSVEKRCEEFAHASQEARVFGVRLGAGSGWLHGDFDSGPSCR